MQPKYSLLTAILVIAGLACSCRSLPSDPRVRMEPHLNSTVAVTNVVTTTNEADLTQVQVILGNRTSRTQQVEVRVSWLDDQGLVQDSLTEHWQTVSVGRSVEARFKSTAPSPEAKDFRVYIQRKRTN